MAGERTLPGLGLLGFWNYESDGWNDGMDANLRALSALVHLAAGSRTEALPGSPTNGQIRIVPANATANANAIAVRDNGAWVYLVPKIGMRAYIADTESFVTFNGTLWADDAAAGLPDAPADGKSYVRRNGEWVEAATGGGGGGGGIPEAPIDGKLYGRQSEAWAEILGGSGGGAVRDRGTFDASNVGKIPLTEISVEGALASPVPFDNNRRMASPNRVIESFTFSDGVTADAWAFTTPGPDRYTGFQIAYDRAESFPITVEFQNSSEEGFDYFFVSTSGSASIDSGALLTSKSKTGVRRETFQAPAGAHTLYFTYRKDGSGDRGLDTVLIRSLEIPALVGAAPYEAGDVATYTGRRYLYVARASSFEVPGSGRAWVLFAAPGPVIRKMTQAEYDGLATKDANTLYAVTSSSSFSLRLGTLPLAI